MQQPPSAVQQGPYYTQQGGVKYPKNEKEILFWFDTFLGGATTLALKSKLKFHHCFSRQVTQCLIPVADGTTLFRI